jgi:hypothetical protein
MLFIPLMNFFLKIVIVNQQQIIFQLLLHSFYSSLLLATYMCILCMSFILLNFQKLTCYYLLQFIYLPCLSEWVWIVLLFIVFYYFYVILYLICISVFWLDCILQSTLFLMNSISNLTYVDVGSVNVCMYVCMQNAWLVFKWWILSILYCCMVTLCNVRLIYF